ncbi:hypothetical protein LTR05_003519 [Lithohypha guttulata]|uniref:Uncharacterized protein n=1 Tax=Lithohypha guttulata TaxID=1690604 RepID=A0AAN7T033_9EURO|nr:hypothetical protein LTR05_003519 [Lithohypha guttulata]
MATTRKGTYLLLAIVLLCSVYWLQRATDVPRLLDSQASKPEPAGFLRNQHDPASTSPEIQLDRTSSQRQGNTPNLPAPISSPLLPSGYTAAFPRHIWQTSSEAGKANYTEQVQTWKDVKGFEHHWLSDKDADEFVRETFSTTRPSLVNFWNDLSSKSTGSSAPPNAQAPNNKSAIVFDSTASSAIILRADLLRYMLVFARGGVYADIDTSVLLHVDRWIPEDLGSQIINAVIGIEYDDTTYKMFARPISFCQRTLMAKPNHPIFDRAINRVMSNLEFLARRQKVQSLAQLELNKLDVFEATGPGMISDVVLEVIQDQLPDQKISWATFHDQKQGRLFGDVLILPINGFAGGQKHSHAGDPLYGPKLVQYHFGRSWYQPQKPANAKGS